MPRVLLAVLAIALAGCGEGDRRGAAVDEVVVESRAVGRALTSLLVTPAGGGSGLDVLVLHGRTDDLDGPRGVLSDELFAALAALGERAPRVLVVNGGEASYFHDRRDGAWGRYVAEEARARLGGGPVALAGISMGGFGALHLAPRLRPCAVAALSPALWESAADTPAGAFDDAAGFARVGRPGRPAAPLLVEVGADDPFRAAVEAYGARVGVPARVRAGGHDEAFWRARVGDGLRFLVSACGGGPPSAASTGVDRTGLPSPG